jgi:site-specific DNA recombinase
MNAVIYCRVSSKEQVDGTSLESQELACREYATRNHINVSRVFVERGESAKFADRTQLLELLSFCRNRANAIECLLVWKVDRLARNVGDHFNIKAGLLQHNIRVISVTEPIDSKPEGKLLETILAGFAQFDNDIRAARTVQGMRRKIQEGLFPGYAPLGYRSVTLRRKKTEPDQPEQPAFRLLQRAWNEFATGKYMKVEILRSITKWGLRTRGGRPLSKQSLDNIFHNPYYAGVLRDPATGEEYPGRHLPMVSRATFARVQEILGRSRVAVPHRSVRPEFPLRVFVRCANCEHPLTGSFSRGRSNLYPYYHCFRPACDPRGNYPLAHVHDEFATFLSRVSPDQRTLDSVRHRIAALADNWSATSRALQEKRTVEIQRISDQQRQLIHMKMDQLINDEEFIAQRSLLASRLVELEAHEEEQAPDAGAVLEKIDDICAPIMDLASAWERIPVEFQRRFQLLILPDGYVFGRVGTAPRGRLLSFFRGSDTAKLTMVPQMGLCWNQLATEVDLFAAIFREASECATG